MSRWVPYAISHILSFSRNPVGLIMMLNGYEENLKNKSKQTLREIARDTRDVMRNYLLSAYAGLARNSERVIEVKGRNSPGSDTGDMVMAIKVRVIRETKSRGVGFFVGIPENAGYGGNHPGVVTTNFFNKVSGSLKALPDLARMTITGFPVINPRTKLVMGRAPARDFLTPSKRYAQALVRKNIKNAVVTSLEEFRNV